MRAEQPLIEEAIRREARQPVLPEVEGRHRDERRHEAFECVETAVVGNMRADVTEPLIDLRLHPARGFLDPVARPAGSEERRVGKECVRTGGSGWWPEH